jgi:hypothetical protein
VLKLRDLGSCPWQFLVTRSVVVAFETRRRDLLSLWSLHPTDSLGNVVDLALRVRWASFGMLLGGTGACSSSEFECKIDSQCLHEVAGSCVDGRCAFPDEDCPSGLRYGMHGGLLAGRCVPTIDDESDTAVADDGTTTSTSGPSGPTGSSESGDTTVVVGSTGGGIDESTSATSDSEDGNTEGTGSAIRNYVFVTSGQIVPGDLGGLAGADEYCQASADAAALPGTYVAWLSTTTVDAIERLGDAQGWARIDGRPFARSAEDLMLREMFYPIRVDELGVDHGVVSTATATGAEGTYIGPSDCDGYTSTTPQVRRGMADGLGSAFTSGWDSSCSSSAPLYCFGVDDAVDLPLLLEPTERRAFVTSASMAATAGVETFDAQCQSEAQLAGLAGTFLALVPTSTGSAIDRFDLGGAPWSMVNDVQVVEAAADLGQADPLLRAPIWRDATGAISSGQVFTGSLVPSATGADVQNCDDWSEPMGLAVVAFRLRTGVWWNASTTSCGASRSVYCLQQ